MCGICGISPSDHRTPDLQLLDQMTKAILHRGPDSDGFYDSPDVTLGACRLRIS